MLFLFFFLGLVAPFVWIFGLIGYVFAIPFLRGATLLGPYWQRISPERRRTLLQMALGILSGLAWGFVIAGALH